MLAPTFPKRTISRKKLQVIMMFALVFVNIALSTILGRSFEDENTVEKMYTQRVKGQKVPMFPTCATSPGLRRVGASHRACELRSALFSTQQEWGKESRGHKARRGGPSSPVCLRASN